MGVRHWWVFCFVLFCFSAASGALVGFFGCFVLFCFSAASGAFMPPFMVPSNSH